MRLTGKIQACAVILSLIYAGGCGRQAPQDDDRVLARINDYDLKVSDFKEAADPALMRRYVSFSSLSDKEQFLETLIAKEVLLQEAQRLNLDKERSFMKEIEGYWEQALLKSLIARRTGEMSIAITVSESEIADAYERLKRRVRAELIVLADRDAAQQLSQAGASYAQAREALQRRIVSEAPADWYAAGDLPPEIEAVLFATEPGARSVPIEFDHAWIVLNVWSDEGLPVEPLDVLRGQIREDILRIKKQRLLEQWSADLRRGASVSINRDLLKEIELR